MIFIATSPWPKVFSEKKVVVVTISNFHLNFLSLWKCWSALAKFGWMLNWFECIWGFDQMLIEVGVSDFADVVLLWNLSPFISSASFLSRSSWTPFSILNIIWKSSLSTTGTALSFRPSTSVFSPLSPSPPHPCHCLSFICVTFGAIWGAKVKLIWRSNMYCGGRANETVLSSRNWYSYHFHLTFIQITFTFMKERRVNVGRANRATIIQSWGRLGVHPSNNIEPRVEI